MGMTIAMLKIEFNWTRCPLKLSPNHLPSRTQCSCHIARWRKAWPYETEMLIKGLLIRWYITCICNGYVDHINPCFSMQSTKTIANFPQAMLRNLAKFIVRECPRGSKWSSKLSLNWAYRLIACPHTLFGQGAVRASGWNWCLVGTVHHQVWVDSYCRWAIIVESTVL